MSSQTELSILVSLKDEAAAGIQKVSGYLANAEQASYNFAKGLLAIGAAVGTFGGFALKAAIDAEQMRVSFTTMLGSADKASVFIKDLVNFAKTTPFELKGLEDASKRLLAFGFTQEQVLPNLKALGDIASGVGMEKLPNLILAFGQVKAAGHLTGMELRQFTEAGVPLLEEISKVTGMSVEEMAGNVGKLHIPFETVRTALINLTGEGGRFNNLMENQSHTLGGMISNLRDAWDIFLRGEGQLLLDWGKKFTLMATNFITTTLPQWIVKIKEIVNWFEQHKIAIYIVAGAIMGALVPAIYATISAFLSAAVALAPFIIGGAIVGGIIYGVVWIVQHWEMLKQKALEVWNAIPEPIKIAVAIISGPIGLLIAGVIALVKNWDVLKAGTIIAWTAIKDFFVSIWEEIKKVFQDSVDWIMNKIQPLLDALNKVKSSVSGLASSLGAAWSNAGANIKQTFGGSMNDGVVQNGRIITTSPDDFILATKNPGSLGGGGLTINIYGDVTGHEVVDKVSEAIMSRLGLNTKFNLS